MLTLNQVSATSLRGKSENYIKKNVCATVFNPVSMTLTSALGGQRALRYIKFIVEDESRPIEFDASLNLRQCLVAYLNDIDEMSEFEDDDHDVGLQLDDGQDDEHDFADDKAAMNDMQALHDASGDHPTHTEHSSDSDEEPVGHESDNDIDDVRWENIIFTMAGVTTVSCWHLRIHEPTLC